MNGDFQCLNPISAPEATSDPAIAARGGIVANDGIRARHVAGIAPAPEPDRGGLPPFRRPGARARHEFWQHPAAA